MSCLNQIQRYLWYLCKAGLILGLERYTLWLGGISGVLYSLSVPQNSTLLKCLGAEGQQASFLPYIAPISLNLWECSLYRQWGNTISLTKPLPKSPAQIFLLSDFPSSLLALVSPFELGLRGYIAQHLFQLNENQILKSIYPSGPWTTQH